MSWVKIEANSRVAQRMYRGILMGILLAFLTACGSTPLPPSVPPFPQPGASTKGIPTPAYVSFEQGVKELEKKPPIYIEAIKMFEQALTEYDNAREQQIGAREQHRKDLKSHEQSLAVWNKEHGP